MLRFGFDVAVPDETATGVDMRKLMIIAALAGATLGLAACKSGTSDNAASATDTTAADMGAAAMATDTAAAAMGAATDTGTAAANGATAMTGATTSATPSGTSGTSGTKGY